MLAFGLLLSNLGNGLLVNNYFKYTYILGLRTRSAVISAVYRKVGIIIIIIIIIIVINPLNTKHDYTVFFFFFFLLAG